MKIELKKDSRVEFSFLSAGDLFKWRGCLYQKLDTSHTAHDSYINAACLHDGRTSLFSDSIGVFPVNGTFTEG